MTDVAGTTRDLVTETIDIEGMRVTLIDTAGLRTTADPIESEGVARSQGAADVADLMLMVSDRSQLPVSAPIALRSGSAQKTLMIASKADQPAAWTRPDAIEVSVVTGQGVGHLRQRITEALEADKPQADRPEITNVRHIALVRRRTIRCAERVMRH